jgi:hydroxymethylpyrimidine/phosphomethylpyrimidine kinase
MKTALTIAGSDPTGGAGLQMDLKVFHALGVHGYSIPTALTAQNTEGVEAVLPVESGFLERQFSALLSDVTPDALKTGMLYTSFAVLFTAELIEEHGLKNLVIDPVTMSSSGRLLVEDDALERMRTALFPLARVVTPNIYEASVLTGVCIETEEELDEAARALKDLGPEVVIITGGHGENEVSMDLYFDGREFLRIERERLPGEHHGTGCAFSAAIAAFLAQDRSPAEALREARDFLQNAIRDAHHPGRGMGLLKI